jgi:hypothetical protein
MIQIINNTGAIIKEQIILGDIDNLNIDDLFNNTNNKKMITQNYPTWLVPIEIAQQLKEIGFKEKCLFYSSMAITGTTTYECIEIEERIHNESPNCIELMELKKHNYNKVKGCVSLPTWTEVFAWFRARGLYSYIRSYIAPENFYIYSIYDNNNFDKCCGRRDTYEEAQKECVKALIKTYKTMKK